MPFPAVPLVDAVRVELSSLMSLCGTALFGIPCNENTVPSQFAPPPPPRPRFAFGEESIHSRTAPAPVVPVTDREHLRTILSNSWHPGATPVCLLVPRSLISCHSGQQLVKGMTAVHIYPAEHSLSRAMLLKRPSDVLVYFHTPSTLKVASCSSLSLAAPSNQDMVFTGHVNQTKVVTLFDSGATTSFISRSMCTSLGLKIYNPHFKAVSLASGAASQIEGRVSFTIRWGPISTLIEAHVIDHLIADIDLIAGSDFLTSNHAVLDYDLGQCTLRTQAGNRANLKVPRPSDFSTREASYPVEEAQNPIHLIPREAQYPGQEAEYPVISKEAPTPINPHEASSHAHEAQYHASLPPSVPSLTRAQAMRAIRTGATPFLVVVRQDVDPFSSRLPDMSHVPAEYRDKLTALLERFSSVFSDTLPPGLPPNLAPCEVIPTEPGAKPPFRQPFRLSPLEHAEIKKQVVDLLARGVIEPSSSPYGSPCFFVSKPNGGIRHVYDYRALNSITVRNRFPLPRIDDLMDSFRGASLFSSLDLTDGYGQLRLDASDIPKTAFTTPQGHFHFLTMSQGLANAPAVFSRAMSKIFAKHIHKDPSSGGPRVLIYLDDICVISSATAGAAGHLADLEAVLQTIKEHGLVVKLSKCSWWQQQLKFLGHIISAEGVSPDPAKLKAIADWPYPSDAKGMQRFLGTANYFCKGAGNYARLAAPLFHLCKKNVHYSHDSIYLTSFEQVKHAMSTIPILAHPDPDKPYELVSDASISGCGAVLIQEGKPVAYYSAKFSGAETRYSTGEQELLGVVKALKEWRCYLEGCVSLVVVTDHNPLIYFPTQTVLSRRQSRWSDFMSRFKFTWKHTPGINNPADAISRIYCSMMRLNALTTVLELNHEFITQFPQAYILDTRFTDTHFTRNMTTSGGFWYNRANRLVVPLSMQDAVMQAHHATAYAGHFGVARTVEHISRQFWWPGLHASVQTYCDSCPQCQQNKASNKRPFGLLQPHSIPDSRWSVVSLDFVSGLPMTSRKHDSIFVFVDKLTKMVHLAATSKTCSTKHASQLFLQHVWAQHGSPVTLISDRDTRFTSDFWQQFCTLLGITTKMSTAYHPQTDGQTERANRTIEEVLRHFTASSPGSWDDLLPYVEFAMNNAKSASTGETPFFLNYGTHPRTPVVNQLPVRNPPWNILPSIESVFANRDAVMHRVRNLLQSAQDRQKHYADNSRRPHAFTAGQQVLLSTKNLQFQGKGKRKLYPKFVGPFSILHMHGINAAVLALPDDWKIHPVFHVSMLKPFTARPGAAGTTSIPSVMEGLPYYQVEEILTHRDRSIGRKTVREYLVKWVDQSSDHNSWQATDSVPPSLLETYSRSALSQRGGNCSTTDAPMTRSKSRAKALSQ